MATENLPPGGRVVYNAPAQMRPHEPGQHSWVTGMSPLLMGSAPADDLPSITLSALLTLGSSTDDGRLVEAVATPWFKILELIKRDPASIYEITPEQWEQIIAGAYVAAGFDEVVLTPRSGDHGRDVIASKHGVGSIRIFDQVKAYAAGRVVTAEEVRALGGTLMGFNNVSKSVVTTTATFAPRIDQDAGLKNLIPYRLELRPRDVLLPWLDDILARARTP